MSASFSMFNQVVQSVRLSVTSFTPRVNTKPKPQRHTEIRRLSVVTYGDDRFNPQRVQFSWLKLICATRDVGDDANLERISEKQWQIGLNTWHIIIEPGLATKVFHKMIANSLKGFGSSQKALARGDFVGSVLREIQHREAFERRVRMTREDVDSLVLPNNEDPLVAVLTSKIIFSLLEGVGLNIFEWMRKKSSFGMDLSAMRIEDLLSVAETLDDNQWQDKLDIMQQIGTRDESKNDWTAENAYRCLALWSTSMSDERSQLVRVACETCPVVVRQMVDCDAFGESHAELVLDGLLFPIRATRSRQLSSLGLRSGEEVTDVLLEKATGKTKVVIVKFVELLCEAIDANAKHGSAKRAFLRYIERIVSTLANGISAMDVLLCMFDGQEEASRLIARALESTLGDKHPVVRDAAFSLATLLDGISRPSHLQIAVQGNVMSQMDAMVRLRFERRKMKAEGRKRPARPKMKPRAASHNPSTDVAQEMGVNESEDLFDAPSVDKGPRRLSVPFPPLSLW